jgi:hypothetical protein
MFILLCEFFVVLEYDEGNCNLASNVFWNTNSLIWNNHEYDVLMNGIMKYVKNKDRNGECMHMKCKYIVTVEWNNLAKNKFSWWSWRIFFYFYYSNKQVFL